MEERALILDTGAVLAIIRRNARVLAFLEVAQRRGIPLVIPPVVVTQVIRGGPGDARANRLFETAYLSFVGPRLARVAGRLLAESGLSDAADAQIVAEAMRLAPSAILTSDPDDIRRLTAGAPRVRVIVV
jgi:predicted nucleic acid-binding protein